MELIKSSNLGIKELKVLNNALIFKRDDGVLCGKKVLKVSNIVTSINDLDDHEVVRYLKTYFNSLNLGFPIEVKVIFSPVNKDKLVSELDKRIQNLLIMVDVNPSNVRARSELEKLRKFRDKITRHNIHPYDVIAYYAVEACGNSERDVIELVNSRAALLKKTLEALGIIADELKGVEGRALLQIFFRGYSGRLVNTILKLLRYRPSIRMASPLATLFNPHIIHSHTKTYLRDSGIYLGLNMLTSEDVFWNVQNCLNPHALIVGPTGIGKTEFLVTLGLRTYLTYLTKVFIIDVKGEYFERCLKRGLKPEVISLGDDVGLGLTYLINLIPKSFRANFLTEVISNSMLLENDKGVIASLYRVLSDALEFYDSGITKFWGIVKDLIASIDDSYVQYRLTRLINSVETLDRGTPLLNKVSEVNGVAVINLSAVASLGAEYLNLAMSSAFSTIQLLHMGSVKNASIPRVQIIVDEAWQFINQRSSSLLKFIKLGRGYGVSVALATQSLHDLGDLAKDYIENSGLLVAMPSPDTAYWRELSDYMRLSYDDIRNYTLLLSRGDAIVRILPDPRPLPVRLDHEI